MGWDGDDHSEKERNLRSRSEAMTSRDLMPGWRLTKHHSRCQQRIKDEMPWRRCTQGLLMVSAWRLDESCRSTANEEATRWGATGKAGITSAQLNSNSIAGWSLSNQRIEASMLSRIRRRHLVVVEEEDLRWAQDGRWPSVLHAARYKKKAVWPSVLQQQGIRRRQAGCHLKVAQMTFRLFSLKTLRTYWEEDNENRTRMHGNSAR